MPTFDPAALREEAQRLDRSLRRRNAVELVVGAGLLVFFGAAFLREVGSGDGPGALVAALLWLGVVAVMVGLWRRGRAPQTDHSAELAGFLAAHRAELAWQVKLLRDVPRWYIGPLIPGLLATYGLRAWRRLAGLPAAELWGPGSSLLLAVGVTAAVLLGIAWLNRVAARRLEARLAALPELGDLSGAAGE